jgi:hypothetical protein
MNVFLMSNGYGTQGFTDPGFWDTKLTRNGEKQAKKINDNIQKLVSRSPTLSTRHSPARLVDGQKPRRLVCCVTHLFVEPHRRVTLT